MSDEHRLRSSGSLGRVPEAWQAPPPRRLPPGTVAAVAASVTPVPLVAAVAGGSFAAFYGVVFAALDAPRVLLFAFTAPGLVAVACFAGWLLAITRRVRLLQRGVCAVGRIEAIEPAGRFLGASRVSVRYCFIPAGEEADRAGRTVTRELAALEQAAPGDPVAVCYSPGDPRRSIALMALP